MPFVPAAEVQVSSKLRFVSSGDAAVREESEPGLLDQAQEWWNQPAQQSVTRDEYIPLTDEEMSREGGILPETLREDIHRGPGALLDRGRLAMGRLAHEVIPQDAGGAVKAGLYNNPATLAHTGSAAVENLESVIGPATQQKAGGPSLEWVRALNQAGGAVARYFGSDAETGLQAVSQYLQETYGNLAEAAAGAMASDPGMMDKVIRGVVSSPAMLGEAVGAVAVMGPAGLPVLVANKASRDPQTGEFTGVANTLRGGAEGLAMAYGMHRAGMAPTLAGKVTRGAPVGGLLAAKHGGDASDITAESIVMGGLAGMSGRGRAVEPPAKKAGGGLEELVAPPPIPAGDTLLGKPKKAKPVMKPEPIPRTAMEPVIAEPVEPVPPPVEVAPQVPKAPKLVKRPVLAMLRARGGVHPEGSLAAELRTMGVNSKSAPGLFKRKSGAIKSADNIPLLEEELFWGRVEVGSDGYIPEHTILEAVRAEMRGEPWRTEAQYQAEQVRAERGGNETKEPGIVPDEPMPVYRPAEDIEFSQKPKGFIPAEQAEGVQAMAAAAGPGEAYVGSIEGTLPKADATTKTKAPLRREKILQRLATDLGTTFYQGHMGSRGKGVAGFYRRRVAEVRTRKHADLETAAHEAAHLIQDRYPEIVKAYKTDPAMDKELRAISYDASKPREGHAEFMRLWLTQPAQASRLAPRAEAYLEGLMARNPDLADALNTAREGMTEWFAQDALTRAQSKIGPGGADLTVPAGRSNWLQQRLADDLHALKVFEKKLRGELPSAEKSAYKTARIMRSKHDTAANTLKFGVPVRTQDGAVRFEGKGLNEILSPFEQAGDLEPFLQYMIGRRSAELRERGKENLFTDEETLSMLALEKPGYRKAADDYQTFNHGLVKFAVDSGVIAPEAAEAMSRYFYVPFFREGAQAGGRKGSPSGDVKATHRITGGTANLKDTLTSVLENIDRMVDLSVTNEARLQVAELAREPGAGRFLAKIPKDSKRLTVLADEAKAEFARQKGYDLKQPKIRKLVDAIWQDVGPMLEFWQHGQAPKGDNLFAVMEKGKPSYYEVGDPELLRALLSFNRPGTKAPFLHAVKNLIQYTITHSPEFMIANITRDTLTAGIMGKFGFKPVVDSARGLRSRMAEDQTYKDFIANGGGMGGLYSPEHTRAQLYSMARHGGITPKHILDTPMKLVRALNEISEAFELATRIGAYKAAVEKGVHPREADYEAREISADFAMRGDAASLQFFLDTVPFLKAGLTGLHRGARAMVSDEHRVQVAQRIGMLAAFSAANAAHNYGNPLYDNQSDAMKHTYWHFLVPTKEALVNATQGIGSTDVELEDTIKTGSDKESREAFEELSSRYNHFTLPKNWEIGSIATVAELGIEGILGKQPKDVALESAAAIVRNFHFGVVPGAFEPIAESIANRSFFTGAPIVPRSEEGKEWGYQHTTRTPRVLREVGEKTGVSPIEIDHFLRSYFNAFANYGLMAADQLLYGDEIEEQQNPITRRFYRKDSSGSQPVRELGDMYRELDAMHQTLRSLQKERDPKRAKDYLEEHRPELVKRAKLKPASDTIADIRSLEKSVRGFRRLEDVQAAAEGWAKAQKNERLLKNLRAGPWKTIGMLKSALIEDIRRAKTRTATRTLEHFTAPTGANEGRTQ